MRHRSIPSPLARLTLRVLPRMTLQRMIHALMGRMGQAHPRLFANLERLEHADVLVEPTDVPHRFLLSFGGDPASLSVLDSQIPKTQAQIKGSLKILLAMLEGQIDGDKMFFTRELEITGNSAVIVALRNTLDREEINLLNDTSSLFGPFAGPLRTAIGFADDFGRTIKGRIEEIAAQRLRDTDESALKTECDALRTEVQELKSRLAKMEVSQKRKKASAS